MSSTSPAKIPNLCNRLFRAFEESRSRKTKQKYNPTEHSNSLDFSGWRVEMPSPSAPSRSATPGDWDEPPSDVVVEEKIILEELLTVFLGGDSYLIRVVNFSRRTGKKKFNLSPSIDEMNAEFVRKCLPMAVYYSILCRFVEEHSAKNLQAGRVNQALSGSIDELLISEYVMFIESLEKKNRSGRLHLHELWFHIQNVMTSMKMNAELVLTITENKTQGGLTLTALHEYLNKIVALISLDTRLCFQMTKISSAPYMKSVKEWIFNGVIYDPFNEFMIVENPRVNKETYSEGYWENKYQLRHCMIPSFLDDVKDYILNAGKYLNAMKECADYERKPIDLPPLENLEYSDDNAYNEVIVKAYKHSSKALLKYMLNDHKLIKRISTAKKYFLLEQGDFVAQILDTCNEELDKDINEVMPSRLATLVEMAIKMPTTEDDVPTKIHITSCLKTLDLQSQVTKIMRNVPQKNDSDSIADETLPLTGYEAFTLSMKCRWPVSLVFNTKVQSLYQMLFRHFFYCKHVERLLCNAWILDQTIRSMSHEEMKPYGPALVLRNKMILFLQNMQNYITEDAIEPAWIEFLESVEHCESVDDLIQKHWDFLETCMKDCFLADLKMLSLFRRIVDLCKDAAKFILGLGTLRNVEEYPSYSLHISKLDEEFTKNIVAFLSRIIDMSTRDPSGKLIKLYYRLNFNHFYNQKLAKNGSNVKSNISFIDLRQ
ncbi:Spc97 / Spc98 family [Nesidiocoris tenuis]|uniref:Gamma-tubulin complex component n=1 Tax=Nesidiocoris tenuis TaxID=355587 RepID=A0ABN7AU69_9HEMI|nr:Spc97 / Spc98 family [Nesidiocoris tenuis]